MTKLNNSNKIKTKNNKQFHKIQSQFKKIIN